MGILPRMLLVNVGRSILRLSLRLLLLVSLPAMTVSAIAQISLPPVGIINTIAGNGNNGYSGDGGLATSAELNCPVGVAVDTFGNVYIADPCSYVVREVNAATGTITTIAGNGTAGYSGDGGPAINAQLNYPSSLAVDISGNVYVSDSYNNVIREIVSTPAGVRNIITLVGNGTSGYSGDGGPATGAELDTPQGIDIDTHGNLYIADMGNCAIRKISSSTGNISTIAGTGSCPWTPSSLIPYLSYPMDVKVDLYGNIFVADWGDFLIKRIDASTNTISVVVGTGGPNSGWIGDLFYPSNVAVDTGDNLYVVNGANNAVGEGDDYPFIQFTAYGTSPSAVIPFVGDGTPEYFGDGGPPQNAEVSYPWQMAFDSRGNLYFADSGNGAIRVIGLTSPPPPTPLTTISRTSQPTTPFVSSVTVSVNGAQQGGYVVSTYAPAVYVAINSSNNLFSCAVAGGSCSPTVTNLPSQTTSTGSAYSVSYAITVQDSDPAATIHYTILKNGVAQQGSVSAGGVISFSTSGGTTLTGTMYATEPGYAQSETGFLSF